MGDDDFDAEFKSPAAAAHDRLIAKEPPTDSDVAITAPLLKKLADRERVPFVIVGDAIVLGFNGVLYPNVLGGRQARQILQTDSRTHEQDRRISVENLDSEGVVGDSGLLYSSGLDDPYAEHDDDDSQAWETPYQAAGYEEIFSRDQMRLMVKEVERLEAEVKRLEAAKETVPVKTSDLLKFHKKELGQNTYQGRIKSADPEHEKVRQRVFRNIHDFYEMIEEYGGDEGQVIAAYFREYIKTGSDCRHTGPWKWKFS